MTDNLRPPPALDAANRPASLLSQLRLLRDSTEDADVARLVRKAAERIERLERRWDRVTRTLRPFLIEADREDQGL